MPGEASSPDRFFHRSFEIDPVNVARTLLDWREQWYEAGWDGTFPDDAPARLADMAAVEAIAKGRVPPTHGERLQRIAEVLKERRTQFERVELLCLLFIHPPAHGSEVSPAARNTLDSARIPRASKLLICGLFLKGRVLAQDGEQPQQEQGEAHDEKPRVVYYLPDNGRMRKMPGVEIVQLPEEKRNGQRGSKEMNDE